MTKREIAFFNVAKEMSKLSDYPQHKLGCCIVDKHRVISSGYNSRIKTEPIQAKLDSKRYGCECRGCVHAETSAIIPLIKRNVDLRGTSIYVYREHKNGVPAMAKPCEGCQSLIRAVGIKKIFWTVEGGYAQDKW